MNVASILELYTTGYGWAIYNLIFSIFVATGIIAIPFVLLVVESWRSASEQSSTVSLGAITSIQTIKWGLIVKLFVYVIAVVPVGELELNSLAFTNSCNIDGTLGTDSTTIPTDASTLSDFQGFQATSTARVPLMFDFAMRVGSGLNNFIVTNIPCVPQVTTVNNAVRNISITNPEVARQYDQFLSQCYVPAKSNYHNASGQYRDELITASDAFPRDELLELDSDFFRNTPGLYAQCPANANGCRTLRAKDPVPGFPVQPDGRDADFSDAQIEAGNGQPFCGEWWEQLRVDIVDTTEFNQALTQEDARNGLVEKVIDVFRRIGDGVASFTSTEDELQKQVIRSVTSTTPTTITNMYGANAENDSVAVRAGEIASGGTLFSSIAGGAAAAGVFGLASVIPGVGGVVEDSVSSFFGFFLFMQFIKTAAPMMQAIVLMLVYGFLPIYMLLGRFELNAMITAMTLIIVVKLFTSVFEIANYLDQALFLAMYPELNFIGSIVAFGPKRLVLEMVVLSLYIVGPLVLINLVGIAGTNISGVADAGSGSTRAGGQFASGAASRIGNGAGRAGRALGGNQRSAVINRTVNTR